MIKPFFRQIKRKFFRHLKIRVLSINDDYTVAMISGDILSISNNDEPDKPVLNISNIKLGRSTEITITINPYKMKEV